MKTISCAERNNAVAILTGATAGIGIEIVQQLSERELFIGMANMANMSKESKR